MANYRAAWQVINKKVINSENELLSNTNDILKILGMFQNSVNIQSPKYLDCALTKYEVGITDKMIEHTQSFLDQLIKHRSGFNERINNYENKQDMQSVTCLTLVRCPELISNEVMSYLSPISRLDNLRCKYTNSFIINGLSKKNITQLKFIYKNYFIEVITFIRYMKNLPDVHGRLEEIYNNIYLYSKDEFNSSIKCEKIICIIKLFKTAQKILVRTIIKRTVYDDLCKRVIKLLHILVTVINNPKRKMKTIAANK